MSRTILGGVLGGLALYLVGFIFWGTPLATLAYADAGEQPSAAVQLALSQALSASGSGTYIVPNPATPGGTTLYGQGPVATVHFNTSGFPVLDSAALLVGLALAIVAGLIMAFALAKVAKRSNDFGTTLRVGALIAIAIPLYTEIAGATMNHQGLGYFVYSFLATALGFIACAFVIAKLLRPGVAGQTAV